MQNNPHPQTIYNFIDSYWKECGYAPSTEEIADHVGLCVGVTRSYLVRLRAWGAVGWKPHTMRTIHITGEFRNG